MASRVNITKYSILKNKETNLYERKIWQDGASELTHFNLIKYQGSLLTGDQATVKVFYKNGNVREFSGETNSVYLTTIKTLKEKRNHQKKIQMLDKFDELWNKASPSMPEYFFSDPNKPLVVTNVEEKDLLNTALIGRKKSPTEFAKEVGTTKQNIYGQLSGIRGVTKDTAIRYAERLNVDPVDLLFPKKSVAVWGAVNTLEEVDLEEPYSTGRIYGMNNGETVTVPRDIYSQNIRAIKIHAHGSMYHNQVAFYYKDNASDLEINNKLAVVGAKVKGFLDEELTYYYFGLYENVRGKHFLLNPDPYVEEANKYILKNFNLEFISPIVSTLDPKAVKDATIAAKHIPQTMLIPQAEAEKKLSDLAFDYEMKMKKLKEDTDKDKNKFLEEGSEILKEYQKAQIEVEAEIQKLRGELARHAREVKENANKGIASLFSDTVKKSAPVVKFKKVNKTSA